MCLKRAKLWHDFKNAKNRDKQIQTVKEMTNDVFADKNFLASFRDPRRFFRNFCDIKKHTRIPLDITRT